MAALPAPLGLEEMVGENRCLIFVESHAEQPGPNVFVLHLQHLYAAVIQSGGSAAKATAASSKRP